MAHRTVFVVPALVVAAALAASGCKPPAPPKGGGDGPPIVTVAHPIVDKITLFTDLTGTVDAKDIVDIRPRVSGYIKEVKFEEGKEVAKDQVLFVVDPVIYRAQLKQNEGQVRNYKAQVDKAVADLARTQEAFSKGVSAKTELDSAVAAKGVADAQLFTAEANVAQAEQNLQWTTVRSPVAGRASNVRVPLGNLAVADQSLLTTVVPVDPIYAFFEVDEQTVRAYQKLIAEKKLVSVAEGGKVPVEIQLKDETGYPHKGLLEFVDNRLNPSTGSLTIRGQFENAKIPGTDARPLTPGLFCRGRIPIGKAFDGILIPDAAVASDQGKKLVYVVDAEHRVAARPVVLGPLSRGLRLVTEGLTTNDRVVIRGMGRVIPGGLVEELQGTITPPPAATP